MTGVEEWTFVPVVAGRISAQAYLWVYHNIPLMDWDHNSDGFLFKHEQDAIMFSLRWL
jgi:hypothetical protein